MALGFNTHLNDTGYLPEYNSFQRLPQISCTCMPVSSEKYNYIFFGPVDLRPIVDPKSASNVPLPMENARPLVKEAPNLAWHFSWVMLGSDNGQRDVLGESCSQRWVKIPFTRLEVSCTVGFWSTQHLLNVPRCGSAFAKVPAINHKQQWSGEIWWEKMLLQLL